MNTEQKELFNISVTKFALLSFSTLGLYNIYWFYKNIRILNPNESKALSFLKALFNPLYIFIFITEIFKRGLIMDIKPNYSAGLLTIVYILLTVSWRLPDPYWLISMLDFLPLLALQSYINEYNSKLNTDNTICNSYTKEAIAVICIGFAFIALVVLGTITNL